MEESWKEYESQVHNVIHSNSKTTTSTPSLITLQTLKEQVHRLSQAQQEVEPLEMDSKLYPLFRIMHVYHHLKQHGEIAMYYEKHRSVRNKKRKGRQDELL